MNIAYRLLASFYLMGVGYMTLNVMAFMIYAELKGKVIENVNKFAATRFLLAWIWPLLLFSKETRRLLNAFVTKL